MLGRQSGAVFADAAVEIARELDVRGVVVTGSNYTGELPQDPAVVADACRGLGEPMRGLSMEAIPEEARLQARGW